MDIQKEREAFEAWLFKEYPGAKDFMIVYRPDENIYEHRPTQVRWEAWQAAKAQAVPDGCMVVDSEPNRKVLEKLSYIFPDICDSRIFVAAYKAMIEAQEPTND
ncbi:hypothetical protein [Acinetobacter indicus]|uniref:hypothetical protein n=1 Tax=Acinetobacter indicus TaxID=756892 RepID=UPI000CECC231|nr:hypothetical protein [Acinetobacter indicus]